MAHRPNIFRELKDNHQMVSDRLADDVYGDQYSLEKRRLDALDEFIRYASSLSYVKHKDTKARLEYYLKESSFSCRSTAAHFDIDNINRVEQTVKNASDKLRRIIGGFLKAVMQATDIEAIDEAIQKFRGSPAQPGTDGYFIPGSTNSLPSPKYDPSIRLDDCRRELSNLLIFSISFSEYLLTQACDQDKLANIRSLLNTRYGSAMDREALKKLYNGEFSRSVDGKQLSIQAQVDLMFDWLNQQNPYKSLKEADDNATDDY